jgi:hypothetical protein
MRFYLPDDPEPVPASRQPDLALVATVVFSGGP